MNEIALALAIVVLWFFFLIAATIWKHEKHWVREARRRV